MPSQFLRRAAALILSVALSLSIASTLVKAQDAGDIDALKRQVHQLYQAGKYTDALVLQRRVVAEIEKAEMASAGNPGAKTVSALTRVAWYALLSHHFKEALAASDRAHALGPANLAVEINRAHALLFMGRIGEARAIYFAHKGKPMSLTDDRMWEDVIANDFEALRKGGLDRSAARRINAKLGGKSATGDAGLIEFNRSLRELKQAGNYKEAEPLAEKYVAMAREIYGEDHPKFGTATSWLGSILKGQRRDGEAEPLFKRALAIYEKALGPDHLEVGIGLSNLAALYLAQRRDAEAEPLLKRALAIDDNALGPDQSDVGVVLDNLAAMYRDQGRYAEAEPLYRRTLAITEKALGPDHPNVGTRLSDLASVYQDQGRYAEAEPLFKRALAIDEKARGPDHRDVGTNLNNLASLYQDQGRYAEAEPLYKRALAIDEKARGPDDPEVGTQLDNLAELYQIQGRYAEAEPLMKRALAITEKALGPEHPDVGIRLHSLAELYQNQGRYSEAEPLMKRALAIHEKALGPDHPYVGGDLNNLAQLYAAQGRYVEAEAPYKRALAIDEKGLGPDHSHVGADLNNLAQLYQVQGRYAEAEPLVKRALAIAEKAFGPDHPNVGSAVNSLSGLYYAQGRFGEAEPLIKRALAISEKAFGPDHPNVGTDLNNLAILNFSQNDWARASDYWRRSTSVTIRRTQRGTLVVGQALTGGQKSEAAQLSPTFRNFIKAVSRLESEQGNDANPLRETFQIAQWAQSSEAAQSLAQMAARGAKGDPKLPALVRERQDLVVEWQRRDQVRNAAVAQAPDKRNREAEAENVAQLAAIDARIALIDKELAASFPDYAALASPAPLSVEEVQGQLAADEALVLFLDTPEWKPAPEETFIWVVTKTDARWVRSELGTLALSRDVSALRCGLDYQGSWTDSHCSDLLNSAYTPADHDVFGKPLPFDLARANKLYKALFGQIEEVIKGKRLLIVPSGPLTQLPFQVLVESLPSDVSVVERSREIGRLGAELGNLSDDDRKRLQLKDAGVRIVRPLKDSAAEAAGLKPDDIVLSLDGVELASYQKLIEAIQAHAPGDKVQIKILRDGAELALTATLGAITIREWIPRFLRNVEGESITWLARKYAITVLPAVSSLKALRELAKQSHASEAYIGFGNPLLDGEPEKFKEDGAAAKLAREKRCGPTLRQRVAPLLSLRGGTRGITRSSGGVVNVVDLRSWAPLPETADELCDVAHDLGVDPATHLYLGAMATETKIKQLSESGALASYKIVHFATHGAVAGQVSRASEPGLLLTPPDKASETDDGYLTASEIAALKLDADWVILSACNTAAGGAQGAEALSGLARAFFYAGARSLLVSHWEVASDATVRLITKAIAELKADPQIGRAEALRRSMLSMITSGKDYEAHPAFWAPFVLVGEGGAER
jgi:CHAT domain-containing protein/tetratricopeptide (TPR) repeat protein